MQTLALSTRKGLHLFSASGEMCAHHFAGEPVTQFLAQDGLWIACLNLGHFGLKLKRSRDQGITWQEIAAPAFPPKPSAGDWHDDPTPWAVSHVWSIAADSVGRIWAGCMPAGLFRSDDQGESWQLMRPLWFNDKRRAWFGGGNDHPGIHSILIDPNDRHTVTVAISCGGLWRTEDGGDTWRNIGTGMAASYVPGEQAADPNTQDPHLVSACVSAPNRWWMQHHCGLYRSDNAGEHWSPIKARLDFGFTMLADPKNPNRAWTVPAHADTHRYAPAGALVVNRTDDGGLTWHECREGLPQHHCYHLIYRHGLALASDGQTLAMGSTTGGVWLSLNAGDSWQRLPAELALINAVAWV